MNNVISDNILSGSKMHHSKSCYSLSWYQCYMLRHPDEY